MDYTLGDWLRDKRDEFGYTNEEISTLLDINPSTWARFLRNERNVTKMHVMAFCYIFKEPKYLPIYELVPEDRRRKPKLGKHVWVFNLDNGLIEKHSTINDAARAYHVKPITIREWADSGRVIFEDRYFVIEE